MKPETLKKLRENHPRSKAWEESQKQEIIASFNNCPDAFMQYSLDLTHVKTAKDLLDVCASAGLENIDTGARIVAMMAFFTSKHIANEIVDQFLEGQE